jgi:hypothetical protein
MAPAIAKVIPKAAEYGKTFTAAQLNLEYQKLYTVALALSVLASALVLWALLRHRSYASHLIFSAHYLAVVMFSSTVIGLAARALGLPMQVSFAAILWTESYRLLALRRSYGLPWKGAIGRWAVLFVCGFFVDYILTTGALILALKRV